jgi:hypothetical protein
VAKAKSISAAELAKLTRAAVKAATESAPGTFVGKGPTMGFVLRDQTPIPEQLALATRITEGVAANAKTVSSLRLQPKPVVVVRPGKIILGFIAPELGIQIRD